MKKLVSLLFISVFSLAIALPAAAAVQTAQPGAPIILAAADSGKAKPAAKPAAKAKEAKAKGAAKSDKAKKAKKAKVKKPKAKAKAAAKK